MNKDEFLRFSSEASNWIAEYFETIRDYPVLSRSVPGDLIRALPGEAPLLGEPMESILQDFRDLIVPGLTHWNHPRFLGYFANSSTPPGVIAEMLAAAINVNAMLWRASPAATELEQVTLGWLRQWLGLPAEFFGLIYDTASISTFHALVAAREQAAPEARATGNPPGLIIYTSDHAHSSVDKAAIAAGIGHSNVRKVPIDSDFRMDAAALAMAIARDREAGLRPICVVATTGTTPTAAMDPVSEIADIAEREGLWLHVDAAYGGCFAILEEVRPRFAGWERADSIVVNPHKNLLVPVDLSVLYTRKAATLGRAFSLQRDYLDTPPEEQNLMDYGVPLGRRFRALKLWFVMRAYGLSGAQGFLARHLQIAMEFAALVQGDTRFELAAPPSFSLVCFRARTGDEATRRLLEAVNRSGLALLSSTVLNGKLALRLAVGNFQTTPEDIRDVWTFLQAEIERE
jgi:aromatic-L-amino-acid decarboxylase